MADKNKLCKEGKLNPSHRREWEYTYITYDVHFLRTTDLEDLDFCRERTRLLWRQADDM